MKNIRLLEWGGISGLTPGEMFLQMLTTCTVNNIVIKVKPFL